MFNIQTLNNIADAGLRRFNRERYTIASEQETPDAILLRSHKMHDMQIPDSVLAIGRAGAGVNNIPVDQMSARGVPVFNAPGANANAVKELVLASLFLAARNLLPAADYVSKLEGTNEELAKAVEAGKKQFVGYELPRKTLGVIGLGAIGVQVANASLGLGMVVIGYDPQITVSRAWQMHSGVRKAVNLEDAFSKSELLTLHIPLNDATRGLVNKERLSLMRDGSVLINFSRDGIVDLEAVKWALDSGKLKTYVTDFPTLELKNRPDVIALPHLGASTGEAEENSAVMVADNVMDFLENGNIRHSVNFPEAVLERTRPHRLVIPHRNIPSMVAQILTCLAEEDINIADMLNQSKGDISYTVVDIDSPASEDAVQRIKSINGILSARVLPISE